jgi:hypothetical protein
MAMEGARLHPQLKEHRQTAIVRSKDRRFTFHHPHVGSS